MISSTILALGPPLMTDEYTKEIPTDCYSYPPGQTAGCDLSSGSSGSKSSTWSVADIPATKLKVYKSIFDNLDKDNSGFLTADQFKGFIDGDDAFKTEADK